VQFLQLFGVGGHPTDAVVLLERELNQLTCNYYVLWRQVLYLKRQLKKNLLSWTNQRIC